MVTKCHGPDLSIKAEPLNAVIESTSRSTDCQMSLVHRLRSSQVNLRRLRLHQEFRASLPNNLLDDHGRELVIKSASRNVETARLTHQGQRAGGDPEWSSDDGQAHQPQTIGHIDRKSTAHNSHRHIAGITTKASAAAHPPLMTRHHDRQHTMKGRGGDKLDAEGSAEIAQFECPSTPREFAGSGQTTQTTSNNAPITPDSQAS